MISNIKIGDNIRVEKIEVINQSNDIANNYWIEGILYKNIIVGDNISVLRYRNFREPDNDLNFGIFTSSPIISIEPQLDSLIIKTQNSIYKITLI